VYRLKGEFNQPYPPHVGPAPGWAVGQFEVEAASCRHKWRVKPAATRQTDPPPPLDTLAFGLYGFPYMKTTLIIPDPIFRDLKRRAAERDETMSALVTEYLVQGLRQARKPKRRFRLPSFSAGRILVDVANRDALYDVLDAERDERLYGIKKRR
jgi:hypothetical protein